MTTDPLTASAVGAAVRRAGYPTGYRYTASGYRTREGQAITKPGTDVTRTGGRRGVRVYVGTPDGDDGTVAQQTIDALAVALAEEFPGRTIVKRGLDHIEVSDDVDTDVQDADGLLYTVTLTVLYEAADEQDAADRFAADYLLPSVQHTASVTAQRADGRGEPVTVVRSIGDEADA